MPDPRWERLEQLFEQTMARPPDCRADFLAVACGTDNGLRDEVASLVGTVEGSGDFLTLPALDALARQIARQGWSVRAGDSVGHYTIEQRLGAGGMGEVWQARDDRLGRDVAIKLLLPHPSDAAARLGAFQNEARAVGALNHPNVLTVFDVGEHRGAPFLVTECLDGESLRARLASGPLPVEEALEIGLQVARALDAAHASGVVHRDLKPENIFLASDGRLKVLDFGLASLRPAVLPAESGERFATLQAGTAGYMAPEQLSGELVDHRADFFALGVVLFEMLTGRRPASSEAIEPILLPASPRRSRETPTPAQSVSRIVGRLLARRPAERFQSASDLISELEAARLSASGSSAGAGWISGRPVVFGILLAVTLTMVVAAWWWESMATRVEWARSVAAPEIQRHLDRGNHAEAFLLARQALDVRPNDPHLRQLWLDASIPARLTTDPEGAAVEFVPYRSPAAEPFHLGHTPLDGVRVPRGPVRLRLSLRGYESIVASGSPPAMHFQLDPVGTTPVGMVRVPGGSNTLPSGQTVMVDDFWIDRFEVTNRQFKAFVDDGGYERPEYWTEPFMAAGRSVPWGRAIQALRDATGRPGPVTWSDGTYPDGHADSPVGGLSWYEAAAYATYVGKSLPTIHHWYRAAGLGRFADILAVSNFGTTGPSAVGTHSGLGPFGTFDMAGNLKEWCATASDERRFILGGAWDEPRYMFADYDARDPFDRAATHGFRLAKYTRPLDPAAAAPVAIERSGGGTDRHTPIADDLFEVYRRHYAYDPKSLNAIVESTVDSGIFRRQVVAFDAAYGGERLRAHLFLPKHAAPPFQAIVFFPANDAFLLRSSGDMSLAWGDVVLRSGRAFVYPIYKGTYERAPVDRAGPNAERDLRIAWFRDLARAIDYLETRTDIDGDAVALYGVSAGATAGVMLSALEPRLKASVLQGAGILTAPTPELDLRNYAPRVRIPTLMLNGRYDFEIPYEQAQKPLFELLGSSAHDKQHTLFETGHALANADVSEAILAWLDRYLGPVRR